MEMKRFAEQLTASLKARGAALAGFADMRAIPAATLPYGVAIAVAVPRDIVREIASGPNARYHDTYNALNKQLGELQAFAVAEIQAAGGQALAQTATAKYRGTAMVGKVPLPHKTVATRAGLGWIGKSALLVTPQYGGAVRITSLLTDMPLPCAQPVTRAECGACDACVRLCPGGAPTGAAWHPGMPREELLNAEACRDTAMALCQKSFGGDAAICGKCFVVCPHTQKYLCAGT